MGKMISRDGFALPAALLALVVVGALVTGGVYAAMEEDRSSANVDHGHHAFMAAERGLQDVYGTRTRPYFESFKNGEVGKADTIGPEIITINGVQAQYTVYVQRLATRLFKVDSEGEVLSGGRYAGSKRRLAEFMRITFTSVAKDRAITTQQPMRIAGQSGISGNDTIPAGWSDCENLGAKTAVVSKDTMTIDVTGSGGLEGTPKMQEDATLDSATFSEYGDMNLDELKAWADITLPPSTYTGMGPVESGGVCDKTQQLNWGDPNDPTGACHLYWPIIYSPGDLHLSTGVGQGILIVDGDLHVTGNFEFTGLVFVYGSLKASGKGNKLSGSVNVLGTIQGSDIGENTGENTGNTQIRLSSCAIDRAHEYSDRFARPIPLDHRKFVDISGLGVD